MASFVEHVTAAMRLFQAGKFEEARAQYAAAHAADPSNTTALHGVAMCLFKQERWDDSIAVAQRILQIDPDDADAQGHVSRCWMRKGDVPRAEAEAAKEKTIRWKLQLREQKAGGGTPPGP